jgi:hypothetical protein
MIFPFWFWFVTTTIALGAIAISSYVVVFMKIAEIDAYERSKSAAGHTEIRQSPGS